MSDYLQPREGVVGELRDQDDLLSLDEKAFPRRRMMANLAMVLQSATLVGAPAPVVKRIYQRMADPQPGDLVLEMSTFHFRYDAPSMGILLARRDEWAQTDEEYAKDYAENLNGEQDGYRAVEHNVYYVQYGPQSDDIYRWTNCSFITVPTDRDFEQKLWGDPTREPGQVVFTRDSVLGALADSGISGGGLDA